MHRHAQPARDVPGAGHQQHPTARLARPGHGVGHRQVSRNQHARHGANLAARQRVAVAGADAFFLLSQLRRGQAHILRAVLHGGTHLRTRQIGSHHRHTRAHRRHHHRAVGGPGPAYVVLLAHQQHVGGSVATEWVAHAAIAVLRARQGTRRRVRFQRMNRPLATATSALAAIKKIVNCGGRRSMQPGRSRKKQQAR